MSGIDKLEESLLSFPKPVGNRRLYIRQQIFSDTLVHLESLGWQVIDIRTLPSDTDADRADSVKACLEGVRMGSIYPEQSLLKFLELEARTIGLLATKTVSMVETKRKSRKLEDLLDFKVS